MSLVTTIHDLIVATLAKHREARAWNDTHVASDLAVQLGLDPTAPAPNAVHSDELVTAEQVAEADDRAHKAIEEAAAAQKELHRLETAFDAQQTEERRTGADEQVAVTDINPASPWPGQTEEVGKPIGLPAVTHALAPHSLAAAEQAAYSAPLTEELLEDLHGVRSPAQPPIGDAHDHVGAEAVHEKPAETRAGDDEAGG